MVSAEAMAKDIQVHWPRDLNSQVNTDRFLVVQDPKQALQMTDAVALLTEWDEVQGYDYANIFDQMLKPVFILDGRRLLDKTALKKQGFKVYTIGD